MTVIARQRVLIPAYPREEQDEVSVTANNNEAQEKHQQCQDQRQKSHGNQKEHHDRN